MTLASDLRILAAEIDWLDEQGTFPRQLSWLAARAREIADADDAAAARALTEEPDFADARKAAEADASGWGKTWAGRAMTFLAAYVRLTAAIDMRLPPPPSVGGRVVVSETRAERPEPIAPPPVIMGDDET